MPPPPAASASGRGCARASPLFASAPSERRRRGQHEPTLPPICADCLLKRRMSPLRQRSNASVITRKRGANCNHSCYDIFTETITGTYMNLRQLEILRAVIRHRTTVAAADELALSQPAISNALFPTTEAMALYKESDAIFALHAKLENRVRDLRECRSGHLSIVATPPLAYSIIPPA